MKIIPKNSYRMHWGSFSSTIGENNEIDVLVTFAISPITPGRNFLSNGDVGYPDEGGELEEFKVEFRGVDISHTLTDAENEKLTNECYQHKNNE